MASINRATQIDRSDEILARLLSPDTLATYEYFKTARRKLPLEPEKRLMQAVLEDAIKTYQLYHCAINGQRRRTFLATQRWLWSHDDEWPFSFENICTTLGLDPSFLRNGLLRWKAQQEARSRHETAALSKRGPSTMPAELRHAVH